MDFRCLLGGEEGALEARIYPGQKSEGQSPPSVIRGDPDLRDYWGQLLQGHKYGALLLLI